jgi:hypothetical protein
MIRLKPVRRFVAALSLLTIVATASASATEEEQSPYWCHNGTCCRIPSTNHDCQFNCGYILQGWVTDVLVNMSCQS